MEYLPQGQGRGLISQYFKAIRTKGIKRKKQNLSCFITCCCSIFMFSFISEVQSVIVFRESFQKGTRSLVIFIFTLFSVKNAANAIKILMTRTTLTIVNKPGPMHHHLPTLLVSFTHPWFPCVSQAEGVIYNHEIMLPRFIRTVRFRISLTLMAKRIACITSTN